MTAPTALSAEDVEARISGLSDWTLDEGRLFREVRCKDFVGAFGLMAKVALVAESMDHHPDWSNSWNKVRIHLVTHSAGGLTDRDFALAKKIDELVQG